MVRNSSSKERRVGPQGIGSAIRKKGGRVTPQRLLVARVFFGMKGHPTAAQILAATRKAGGKVGLATVYRTMALLRELGFARAADFGDGATSFEPVGQSGHHDHLICLGCGKIEEFTEPSIEDLQEKVAERYGFVMLNHRLDILGLCSDCSSRQGES